MTYQGVSNVHRHSHASIPGVWVIWSVLQMQSLRDTAFKLMEKVDQILVGLFGGQGVGGLSGVRHCEIDQMLKG